MAASDEGNVGGGQTQNPEHGHESQLIGNGPVLPPPANEADIPFVQWDGSTEEWCTLQPHNDLGNAGRLRARFGADLAYVRHHGWHGWDGRRWDRTSGEDQAQLKAQQTAAKIREEARLMRRQDMQRAEALAKHAARSGASYAISAMIAQARPHLTLGLEAMDTRPDLVCCANGTLELSAGAVRRRQHRREDRLTRLAPVAYDERADFPLFKEFLAEILPDRDVREFLQRWFGYCLTGYAHEQVLVICHGQGANGKSTLIDVLSHVLGDYTVVLPFSSLLSDDRRRGGDATPDLARLPGARLVTASEPELGKAFSEAVIKTLTGEGRVIARHLREEFFEFAPQFKLVLSCNNKPTVRGNDEGTWRRVLLVPFTETIPPEARDKQLVAKLIAEAPGILNWLVEGAKWYLAEGLAVPEAVRMATGDYRDESDPMGDFLRSWVHIGPAAGGSNLPAARLYLAYEAWCADSMVQPLTQNKFGRKMKDRGYHKQKVSTWYYVDMALSDEAAVAADALARARSRDKEDLAATATPP
jgi:putative DNA primase/helicase